MFKLHDYFRSGASFRVRIALNLKGINFEQLSVHLTRGGGEHLTEEYRAVNPQQLLPSLEHDGKIMTQSLAILEYLEELFPEPSLLPKDPFERAQVRAMAQIIGADTHPIQNLRVLKYLKGKNFDQDAVNAWAAHWIETGFQALEGLILKQGERAGQYFYGDTITLADVVIAPQLVNAKRFGADLSKTPRVVERIERLMVQPAFDAARPERQPDFDA